MADGCCSTLIFLTVDFVVGVAAAMADKILVHRFNIEFEYESTIRRLSEMAKYKCHARERENNLHTYCLESHAVGSLLRF